MPKATATNTTTAPPIISGAEALARLEQEIAHADTVIIQGCDAIMKAYNKNFNKTKGGYEGLVQLIESHATTVAPIPAQSDAGMKAKARVVQELARVGCAMYAVRILAQSLATDVLAGGAA